MDQQRGGAGMELKPENRLWRCATGIVGAALDFVRHPIWPGPTEISGWLDGEAMRVPGGRRNQKES